MSDTTENVYFEALMAGKLSIRGQQLVATQKLLDEARQQVDYLEKKVEELEKKLADPVSPDPDPELTEDQAQGRIRRAK